MEYRNVSPQGALEIPMLGRIVEPDEVFEVSDEDGQFLADQSENFERIWSPAELDAQAAAEKAEAKAEAKRAATEAKALTATPDTNEGDDR